MDPRNKFKRGEDEKTYGYFGKFVVYKKGGGMEYCASNKKERKKQINRQFI